MAPMAKKNSTPWTAKIARWRIWVQAGFLMVWLDPLMLRMHTVCSPVFHCYSCPLATFACPIGILANFSAIHVFPFLAVGTLAIVGVLLGSFICGWVCPFGFIQDLIGKIPTRKFELPAWMGATRYVVLVVFVLAIPYFYGEGNALFFCRLCPAGALEAAVPYTASTAIAGGPIAWPTATKGIILVVMVVAMLFTWRPWCTLFCPLGAIYGICNRISFFFLKFHPSECNDCDVCRKLCNYHGQSERRGGEMSCVRCMDCTQCSAVTLSSVFHRSRKAKAEPELVDITLDVGGKE